MSRQHIMPMVAAEAPVLRRGRRQSRLDTTAGSRSAMRTRPARTGIHCLGMAGSLRAAQGARLVETMLLRVQGCGCPVSTVVLDLSSTETLDPDGCAAMMTLHDRLALLGTKLRLAAGTRALREALAAGGVTARVGADAVHPSFRSAVLATYATLPGPGLVTGQVKAALEMEAEAISP
ncbi:MAG TPA: hypothetical protein VG253_21015 [Streptosporangiaceae bacterium]|nr:hypothetical protein [Streptosporangiaceae bacterium]